MKRIQAILLMAISISLSLPLCSFAAFGLTTTTDYYTVDTGAGLVFKVRRTDNGSSTQSAGDIASSIYNGVEYQNLSRGSQITSGFDYLYSGISAVTVSAQTYGSDYIRITVEAGDLTHYYMARKGYPHIYMATYFTTEPDIHNLVRYIVRIPEAKLPNGPEPSDIRDTTYTVESGDIFGLPNGVTRSKHYSNMRLIDWDYIGATGADVGIFMLRSNHEGDSGGPFYRSLLMQTGSDQEITYIVNYGQAQTEAFRTSVLNGPYTLVFNDGHLPDTNLDYSWIETSGMDADLLGWISESGRGTVSGSVSGIPDGFETVVGFANAQAQYWTTPEADGSYISPPMIPGTYTATLYKQEMEVKTDSVVVSAGATTALDLASAESNPSIIWRLGDRDGTPAGFMNADKVTTMHPSDVRMDDWDLGTFVVGSSTPETGIPCYQWKDVGGGGQTIQFTLTAAQKVSTSVRVGMTIGYSGGRPNIQVNSWTSGLQGASTQPGTRSLTTGSYRGNNTEYSFSVPASALNTGVNTLRVYPISGSGYTGFLSAGYSLDYIEWRGTPAAFPEAPSGLSANTSDSSIDLKWDPVPSAKHYTVERATIAGGPYTTVSSHVGPAHFTDTTATNGTAYFYRVAAVNALGQGSAAEWFATASGLDTHFKFDETAGTNAIDSVGENDGILKSGASWTTGLFNNAVQLDGSANGYIELDDGLVENLTDCTFSTWIYASATPTWSRIFDFGMGTESYMFLTPNSNAGKVRFAITLGGGEQSLVSGSALPLNGWHHVAVTLSADTGKLYVDGSVVDTQTITLDPSDLGLTRQNYIGKSQWSDPNPTAKIDDFRIYSRALGATEIAAMASESIPPAPSSLTASASTNEVGITWTPVSGATSYNVKYSLANGGPYELLAGGLTDTNLTYTSTQAGTNYYVVTAENIAGESLNSPQAEAYVTLPLIPIVPLAYYRFEEGSSGADIPIGGDPVIDSDGGDDNMNAANSTVAPTYSSAVATPSVPNNVLSLAFDGDDFIREVVDGPLKTDSITDFTVEAFVRVTDLTGWQTFIGRNDTGTSANGQDGNPEALFYLSKSGENNAFRVEASTASGNMISVDSSFIAVQNQWYHLAAVGDVDAGTLTLYVDGNSVGTTSGFNGLFDPADNNAWTIGRGQYGGSPADYVVGNIDEVRFSASVLSPDQFLNAFNPDSDADGLDDEWEMANFKNLDQTGTDDPDGDGDDNETEETNGTPPTISSIPPHIEVAIDAGALNLGWPSNNTGWRLEYRTNLLDGIWTYIPDSETTNAYDMQLDLFPNDSVFFKLVYP